MTRGTVDPLCNGHLGDRGKSDIVERLKQESMHGLPPKKAVVERWPLVEA